MVAQEEAQTEGFFLSVSRAWRMDRPLRIGASPLASGFYRPRF